MAERRMFAKTIIDSDAFLDMPLTTQALYFHLSMRADDDGFVNNPKKIQRMTGASDDDAKLLIAKQFIIPFESGVVVIRHWKLHNYIRKDTYSATKCKAEMRLLALDENQAYITVSGEALHACDEPASHPSHPCIQSVAEPLTQDRIGQDRIDQDREREDSPASPPPPKEIRHRYGEYNNVLLSDSDMEKLKAELPGSYQDYIEHLSQYMASKGASYKSHLATIRNWARKDAEKQPQQPEKKEYCYGTYL